MGPDKDTHSTLGLEQQEGCVWPVWIRQQTHGKHFFFTQVLKICFFASIAARFLVTFLLYFFFEPSRGIPLEASFFFFPLQEHTSIIHISSIIVARRPVYVRLALWFLHHPAWVEGHIGGSRLTPTVHPSPVQLGRLWVACVVQEPNEPQ